MTLKKQPIITYIIILFLCGVTTSIVISYILFSYTFRDAFSALQKDISVLEVLVDTKAIDPNSYPSDANLAPKQSYRDGLFNQVKGDFEWTVKENINGTEFKCDDGDGIKSGNKVLNMQIKDSSKASMAYDYIEVSLNSEEWELCAENPGAHAINKTMRKNGFLINYVYILPTVGQPDSSISVSFEYE